MVLKDGGCSVCDQQMTPMYFVGHKVKGESHIGLEPPNPFRSITKEHNVKDL